MLSHPTLETLHDLGLHGCAAGFRALEADPAAAALSHGEWLAVMLEHEVTHRRQKRFAARAARAKLRHAAVIEEVNYRAVRGLDRTLFRLRSEYLAGSVGIRSPDRRYPTEPSVHELLPWEWKRLREQATAA